MKLGKVFKLSSGKSLPAKKRIDGEYNVYGGNGITGNHNESFVTGSTIVIGRVGEYCGATHLTTNNCWVTDNALMVKEWFVDVNKEFMVYALNALNINRYAKTVGQPSISQGTIYELEIDIPSIEKQDQVVSELKKIEQIIQNRKLQLVEYDHLIKSRFIEIFGDPVLNDFNWIKGKLSENTTLINGRAFKQNELLDEGKYPVLRVGNFFSNRSWYYSNLELNEDKYCDNGDLLFAWSASFGPKIWDGGRVIYHYHIWKIIVGKKYNKEFLCELLDLSVESMMRDTHGIAMMHLTKSGMEKAEFIIPPIDLQNDFVQFKESVDKLKSEVQKSLDEMQELFDSLMQKYFD